MYVLLSKYWWRLLRWFRSHVFLLDVTMASGDIPILPSSHVFFCFLVTVATPILLSVHVLPHVRLFALAYSLDGDGSI